MPSRKPPLPDAVPNRTLMAETVASAALALIQRPALWEALSTLALLVETAADRKGEHITTLGPEILSLIEDSNITTAEAEEAVATLTMVDTAARAWAAVSHPGQASAPTEADEAAAAEPMPALAAATRAWDALASTAPAAGTGEIASEQAQAQGCGLTTGQTIPDTATVPG